MGTTKQWARFGAYLVVGLMFYLFDHWGIDRSITFTNWLMMVAVYGLAAYENK